MQSLAVLMQFCGAVALLLFGLRLVRDGMVQAFGIRLKTALALGTRNSPRAFLAGLVATLGLQSSTATALMTASFVEDDMIRPKMAQIVLLGANIGTAVTAWVVAAGIGQVSPLLLFIGFVLYRSKARAAQGSGLALIGIGLMLLSLDLLGQASEPLRGSQALAAFLDLLDNAWLVAFAFSAGLALLCSSSLAVVMLVLSLSAMGGLTPALAVVLVLGANFGGAVPPVLATMRAKAAGRRVVIGNLLVRGIGCAVAMPFAGWIAAELLKLPGAADSLPVEAHLAFNLALAIVVWPFAGLVTRALAAAMPDAKTAPDQGARWLDDAALGTPAIALMGASREALAIGDLIETMMVDTMHAFKRNDPAPLDAVDVLEDRVDRLQQEVKFYLSRLGRGASAEDTRRSIVILDYVINLEHTADVIDKGLAEAVRKKIKYSLRFSDTGYKELNTLFLLTFDNLRIAQTIFMTRDVGLARQLMEVKVDIRRMERESAEQHFYRLCDGDAESLQTSSLHLDMLRDLKRINAHIVSVAHPILDQGGQLVESRLKAVAP